MSSGALIRQARRRHGLDQRSLARRARTSQAQISRIERDETSPSVETLERLLACMGERLVLDAEPLGRGNETTAELRQEFASTTPGERVKRAAELSRTATAIAAAAGER